MLATVSSKSPAARHPRAPRKVESEVEDGGVEDEPVERFRQGGEPYANFPGRTGYDEDFLGIKLPLPQLDKSIRNNAAPLLDDPSQIELKYTHFSTVQDKNRATPIFTAVNIDGAHAVSDVERKGTWAFDARIAREHQMGLEAYSGNGFDRGHQVRRKDPMWGEDWKQAGSDSFVYTNAALQHANLNQKKWLDLENNILTGAIANQERKTVFTGPVMRDDDKVFDNDGKLPTPTKIPTAFWKVQVWNDPKEGLLAEAFVISQKDLIGKPRQRLSYDHIKPMEFKKYRVSMEKLEAMTHIHFGDVKDGPDRAESDAQKALDSGIIAVAPWEQRRTEK